MFVKRLCTALLLAALSFAASAESHLAQYGVQYVAPFKLYNADGTLDVDESDGGTEVSVRCQGGTNATATNDFVDRGSDYEITLTATEMQCATVIVTVAATTTEVFYINTVNHASAAIPTVDADVREFGGTAGTFASGRAEVNTTHIAGSSVSTSSAQIGVNVVNAAGTAWNSGAIGASTLATDTITAAKIAADALGASEVADGAIDAGALAADAITAAKVAADVTTEVQSGLATASALSTVAGNVSSILDDTGTSGVLISTGTGTGQISMSSGVVNANMAQVSGDATAADSFELALDLQGGANGAIPWAGIHASGTAQAYTAGTPSITLAASTAYGDDDLNCTSIAVRGSTQDDWVTGTISDYAGATDIATLSAAFPNAPSGTLTYIVWGTACASGAGGSLTAADVWAYSTRSLTILDEDSTTIDLNATYVGGVTVFDEDLTTIDINATPVGAAASVTGAVGSVTSGVTVTTNNDKTGYALSAAGVDAVWDEATSGHATAGTYGVAITDILTDTSTTLDDFVDDLESRLGTPSNLGGGATVAQNLSDIEAQTDDIGAAGAGLTAADDATLAAIAALNNLSAAQVNSEMDTALADIHLDHLLAVDYDPASKPGVGTALLNELIGNDAGVSQFTANALENGPAGGGGGSSDWNADERTALRAILGIPASGTTPEDVSAGILDTIRDSVATRASQSSVDAVDDFVDDLETRLSATRAGYLDNLSAGAVAQASALTTVGTNVSTALTRIGTPSDLGSGASLAANNADIEAQTDDIGAAGAGLTAVDDAVLAAIAALNNLSATQVRDLVIEPNGNVSLGCILAGIHAYTSGDLTTASNVATYEDHAGTSTRAVMTISSAGNRTVTITCPSY